MGTKSYATRRRFDRWRRGLGWVVLLEAAWLGGCPGTLEDKERFLVDGGRMGSDGGPLGGGDGGGGNTTGGPSDGAVDANADGGSAASEGCSNVVEFVFLPSCGGNGCHGAVAPQNGLDLVSAGVASRVVNVTATSCNVPLADPSNPDNSLLIQKLSPSPPCGAPMPIGRAALTDEQTSCLKAWIAAQSR
jgi:hypothetical protein